MKILCYNYNLGCSTYSTSLSECLLEPGDNEKNQEIITYTGTAAVLPD